MRPLCKEPTELGVDDSAKAKQLGSDEIAFQLAAFAEFEQLLDDPPATQLQRLKALDLTQPLLAARIRELLNADSQSAPGTQRGVLEQGLAQLASLAVLSHQAQFSNAIQQASGEIIGTWKLLEVLGQGGMGVVWKAQRVESGFTQQAAIKLLKHGIDTASVIARFERERQILARLEHPGISRLIDGGLTAQAKPYFAMEYVEGVPITDFAQRHTLSLQDRVALVVQLCLAVDYAHRRLVVHRDIKPSNVLVCASDIEQARDRTANGSVRGSVKVLDFGIAKLLDASDKPRDTQPQERVMSPAYAAPEQLQGGSITVATDVYGIGLVLYELLTGALPHDRDSALAQDLGAQLLRDPIKAPSAMGRNKRAEPKISHLALEVDQDLDLITLQALSTDPDQRYLSAAAFSDDLQRWMRGEPIQARPASWRYRTQKLVSRNKLATAAIALALCIAVGAFAVVVAQRRAALNSEAVARAAQQRAEQAKNFLIALFERADGFSADSIGERTVVDLLLTGQRLLSESKDDPAVRAELLIEVGTSLGRVGKRHEGMQALSEALNLLSQHAETNPMLKARALGYLGYAQNESGDFLSAEQHLLAAQQIYQSSPSNFRRELIGVRTGLAKNANQRGHSLAALALREAIIADRIALVGLRHPDLAMDYSNLATSYSSLARYPEAERAYERAQNMLSELLGPHHMRTMFVLRARASAQLEQGQFARAEASITEVLAVSNANVTAYASLLPPAHLTLARLAFYRHEFSLARTELKLAQIDPKSVAHYAQDRRVHARMSIAEGDYREALVFLKQAIAALDTDGGRSIAFEWSQFLLALTQHLDNVPKTPLTTVVQAYQRLATNEGAGGSEQLEALLLLGSAQRANSEFASALRSHQAALALTQQSQVLGEYGLALAHAELALSYVQIDRQLAKQHAELALPSMRRIAPRDSRVATLSNL